MPYALPNFTALQQMARTDIEAAIGTPLLRKSILGYVADAEANMVFELFGYLSWIATQCTPWLCTDEYLVGWAALKKVVREPANAATGVALFTGTAGTDIPAGSALSTADGTQYFTGNDWQVGSSTPLTITALVAGSAGNAANGVTLTLAVPITGVSSTGTAVQPLVSGTEQELDPSLRQRMLLAYANPSAGGTASDFQLWALDCPGVTRAWVVSEGIGAGSVLVYVMFDVINPPLGFPLGNPGGATLETRIAPATSDLLLVANALYPLRPVTALVEIRGPTPAPIDFVIKALFPSTTPVEAAIRTALQDCLTRLASPVAGNAIYPSDTNAAVESAATSAGASGFHYTLVSPALPISVTLGQLAYCNSVSFVS